MTREMPPAEDAQRPLSMRRDNELVQIVDAALADAARRAGEHLACRPGCTPCCHGAFAIHALDAWRLRTAMQELAATNPMLAGAISNRAKRYLAEFGPAFPGDRDTGILGATEEEQAEFEDFANDAACPALDPQSGLCDLYSARPMVCRTFGPPVRTCADAGEERTFAVCELCFTHATPEEVAAAEMAVPYAEEDALLRSLFPGAAHAKEETIVAYCLTPWRPAREEPS